MHDDTFDLIISDIMMPEIDGYELAKTVRKLNENIPILFMTARDDFVMDGTALTIIYNGEDIPVTVREFNILYKLLSCICK